MSVAIIIRLLPTTVSQPSFAKHMTFQLYHNIASGGARQMIQALTFAYRWGIHPCRTSPENALEDLYTKELTLNSEDCSKLHQVFGYP